MSDPSEEPSGKLPSGPTSNLSGEATGNLSGKLPTSGRDEQADERKGRASRRVIRLASCRASHRRAEGTRK
jgi:hypothetical protein